MACYTPDEKERKGRLRCGELAPHRFGEAASLASILCFVLVGCLLWTKLPAEIAVHFTFSGQPDDFAPKGFVVFGMPLILEGMQAVCLLCSRSRALPPAVSGTVLWITPGISLCVFVLLYCEALGHAANVRLWSEIAVAVTAIALGNVLPKGAAGMRFGVWTKKLTVDDRQKVARFWGYCLVCCGIAMCVAALSDNTVIFFASAAAATILPLVRTWRQVHREQSTSSPQ